MNDSYLWGALFDLDGVLIDSESIYTLFWHDINEKYPTGVEQFEYVIKGNTLSTILNRYFPDREIQLSIIADLQEHESKMEYVLFDGAEDLLRSLRKCGVKSAIVTSSNAKKMEHLFTVLPELRDLVDIVITEGDITMSKPHPEGYLLAAKKLGLPSKRCIVFEDSLAGVCAGRNSGSRVVGIATTNSPEALAPFADLIVESISELTVEKLCELIGD